MSNLALAKSSPLVVRVKNQSGDRLFPIWLLVDPKYPAVHQNIWLPILEEVQDRVYRKLRTRIDTRKIYIENAACELGSVPNTLNCGTTEVAKKILKFRKSILEYKPKILISFGSVTYEFVRLVFKTSNEKRPNYLSSFELENEFNRSIANFDINRSNTIPLPSRVMNSGKFIEESNDPNYFRAVGTKIADRIIENKESFKIWI